MTSNSLPRRTRTARSSHSSHSSNRSSAAEVGLLAEELVAQWLIQANGDILQRRWHCRWGELDLIVSMPDSKEAMLLFVEVKARRRGNWDEDGLLAITSRKQTKLAQTAQMFLAEQPQWANCSCRFDVALVRCQTLLNTSDIHEAMAAWESEIVEVNRSIELGGYRLSLQQYIPGVF